MMQNGQSYKPFEVKKHVNAIHCSNNLTLLQRKLFNALLFNAYSSLPYQSQFEIPTQKLSELIGYNSRDTATLKQALLALISITIEWNIIEESSSKPREKWAASSILASAKLENGLCTYEYSSMMRQLLHKPEMYGRVNMLVVQKFTSGYGLALYENCGRYQRLAQTPWFEIDTFRKLMGVPKDQYTVFSDFKKRVLNIAVNEVNKHSHIVVSPEIQRQNQKVTAIRFKIAPNGIAAKEPSLKGSLGEGRLADTLATDFGLSSSAITEIFNHYGEDYVLEKVNFILGSESYKAGKIHGLAGYLIDALKKNYTANKSSTTLLNDKRQQREIEEHRRAEEENRARQTAREYDDYVSEAIDEYLAEISSSEFEELIVQFEKELREENAIVFKAYEKFALENAAARAFFNKFVQSNRGGELGHILSLEEFLQANLVQPN